MNNDPKETGPPQSGTRIGLNPRSHALDQTRSELTRKFGREPSEAELIMAHRDKT